MFSTTAKKCPCATKVRALLLFAAMLVLASAGTPESKLAAALHGVLEKSIDPAKGVSEVAEWMTPTFHALPKLGQTQRLGPREARHLLQSYFNANYGWEIKGLKTDGMQKELSIIQQKSPKIGKLLSKFQVAANGVSLEELAATAAVVKRLIVRESQAAMKAAWKLQNHSVSTELTWQQMQQVIHSSILLINEWNTNVLDETQLKFGIPRILHEYFDNLLEKAKNNSDAWQSTKDFVASVSSKLLQSESSKSESYSYKAVQKVFEHAFVEYGRFQNTDCVEMKEQLRGMDPSGSGRVSLKAFYSAPENAKFHFTEAPKHMHKLGLLDSTNRQAPSVLVTNYVDSATNCLGAAPHFSICCISACTSLMMQIEAALKAPTGSAATLLSIVSNLTGSEERESRAMLPELAEKLNDIGQRNGGQIPLHGQLFAQWLHYVEPYKCMYPATVSTQANWYKLKALVTDEQRASYAATLSDAASSPASAAHSNLIITQWSDEEHVPHQDNSIQDAIDKNMLVKVHPQTSTAFLRWAFLLAALISSLAVLGSMVRTAFQVYRNKQCEKDLMMDEYKTAAGNKTVAVTKVAKGKSQARKKVSPGQLSSARTPSRSSKSVAKETPQEPDDASCVSLARHIEVSSPNQLPDDIESEDHETRVQELSRDIAGADDASASDSKTTQSLKTESTGPELTILADTEVIDEREGEAASAHHQFVNGAADDIPGERNINDPILDEANDSPMPATRVEGSEQRQDDKAAAAMDASARAAIARAAAAEAAAVAAAAAQSAAAAAAEAEALAAEAADAAAAAASEDPLLHFSSNLQTESQQPDAPSVPSGFEVFERVGLLVPRKNSPSPSQPSLPADQPLLASFRPPPGLELLPPPGLEMLPPPGLGLRTPA
eukprot:TRINITY_DN5600_c0_g1_i1.p1 TRINITY_DN5600_c0_g1~~TRINITY_DN5600_c0_g1_i1.p1  ORF type:complete len:891 (+),score=208.96 TRINITY_DN5600_c0_g1_i1:53-2725(+)